LLLKFSEHCAVHPSKRVTFDLHPVKSFFKVFFQGTELGEILKKMLLSKAVPNGLKVLECEHGLGGKHSPICYITEKDPIQEVLEIKHQPTPLKLTLPSGSEMRWASGTPTHFLIHVRGNLCCQGNGA